MILVKAMIQRKKLGMMPQVPFSIYGSRVSFLLTQLSKSHFPFVDSFFGLRAIGSGDTQSNMYRSG